MFLCDIALYSIRCCFCFGSVSSFFLELFLHWSPVAYWAPTNLGTSSFSILSFCLFILFIGFSRQECWSDLPFPSPVDHILSEFCTMTRLSCVVLQSMGHSFIELDKAVDHVIRLVSFLWLWWILSHFLPWLGAFYRTNYTASHILSTQMSSSYQLKVWVYLLIYAPIIIHHNSNNVWYWFF